MSIIGIIGGSQTFSSASGGKMYAYNGFLTTPAINAVKANTARRRITFHNPGPVDIFIFPQFIINTGSNSVGFAPSTAALGGCFRVFANGGTLTLDGECQGAWGVFAADNSATSALTVMDSNV